MRAAARSRPDERHRRRGRAVPRDGGSAAAGADRLRGVPGRPQLARRLLGPPLPRPARPHRAERELLLPVHRLRAGSDRTGGRAARGGAGAEGTDRHRDPAADGAARPGGVDGAAPLPLLHHPHPRRRAGHGPHPVLRRVAGPVHRAAHRGGGARAAAAAGRHRRGRAPVLPRRAGGGPAGGAPRCARPRRRARQPHVEDPRRVGREPRRAARAGSGQRRGAGRDRTGAAVRVPGGRPAGRAARGVRPAAARRQRQPVVRQGRLADRVPRRHRRVQRRALPPRRHHGDRVPGRGARRVRTAAAGRRRRAHPRRRPDRRGARRRAARRHRRGCRGVHRLRRRHRDDHALGRLQRRAGQGAALLAGRLRAAGVPARPPAGEGPDRRHLRVDRHPLVPPRAHRGDAGGHPRDDRGRRGDPGPRRHRPRGGGAGRPRRARRAGQGVPGRERARAAPLGAADDQPAPRRTGHPAVQQPRLARDARRLPLHQRRPVAADPVLGLRLDQPEVHRRRVRDAARPLRSLPEHAGDRPRTDARLRPRAAARRRRTGGAARGTRDPAG